MSVILDWIRHRLDNNQNFLALLLGGTGSGKSWSALRLGEALDENFSIDNVCFTLEDFLTRLNDGLKKRSCLVLDEASGIAPRRSWYTKSSRVFNFVLDSFRFLNISVLFTAPTITRLDSQSVTLLHGIFETVTIDRISEEVYCKFKRVQHNAVIGRSYFKYVRARTNGRLRTISSLAISKPSEALIQSYEKKKSQYLKQLYKDMELDLRADKAIERQNMLQKTFNLDNTVATIVKDMGKFTREYGGKTFIDIQRVKNEFGIGTERAQQVKRAVEDGYMGQGA